ncbi:M23 family metallopeptidase [Sphingomonas sanxanigenens]|uniref:M23ase beta-sheet core domain-containing protein n=1 Tax=Sphingomonas sanxanigenens DSM 19645 = NX02 TaxID=1123269 RepID=W0AKR5_9SPHN|nr:M23 family metallopeptidase [Sphingomonas sanxanigenens]AHE56893.1 hypothetical protein NX02_26505 [Sphingomonas sanxanigenens DSM 19645 = NX02]
MAIRPLLLLASVMLATPAGAGLRQSLDVAVPRPPAPVTVEGRDQLVYELHLTPFGDRPATLRSITVVDPASGARLAHFADAALAARTQIVGGAGAIPPGGRAIVYIEIDRPKGAAPRRLRHRIVQDGAPGIITPPDILVGPAAPITVGPPLAGGPWVAIHHPDWPRGHRRVVYAVDGRARIPGRFAIDWVRVDAEGRIARGDADRTDAALGYGAPVLAVAEGVVAAIRGDVPENATISANPAHPLEDAAGNYVALEIGPGRYAIYEHLQPGSLRVRAGDRVRRGAVIGRLGFTGDSTGPHLHFHVADRAEPLGGEGLPFVIDRFRLEGRYRDLGRLGTVRWEGFEGVSAVRNGERPGPNVVVRFGE